MNMEKSLENWVVEFQEDDEGTVECRIKIKEHPHFSAVGSGGTRFMAMVDVIGFLIGE
jgi:hypothetical protein